MPAHMDLARAPKEVSVAEQPPAPTGRRAPVLTPDYKCANCKAVGDHLSFDCPIACKECKFNFCPGARHELCAVIADVPPSKRDLKNALGRDLIPKLVAKLDEAWKVKHPGKSIEVSSLELRADSESDDDVPRFGLVIPSSHP